MKPGFYVCGGGGNLDCSYWDDINGCWKNMNDVFSCPFFKDDLDYEEEDEDIEGMET